MKIHSTAIVDSEAQIEDNVVIEPYAIIKGEVHIKEGTYVGHHAYIEGPAEIGKNNQIFQYASIGSAPQDISYRGEKTKLLIGDNNIFREFVTVNRGTSKGLGYTKIGSNNFIMAYSHIAHDCVIEDEVILANNATLAGHILVQRRAIIGGLSAVHQFSRIGSFAMIAGKTGVVKDVPPFTLASGQRAKLYGLNLIGLKRAGFTKEEIDILKKVYHILFTRKFKFTDAVEKVKKEFYHFDAVKTLIDFIESSSRGITFDAN